MRASVAWARAHPLGSLLAFGIAALVFARYGFSAGGLIAGPVSGLLVVLSLIDIESRRLPNAIVLPAAAVVLAARLATAPDHWRAWLGAALGAAALLLACALASSGGFGLGDVKLTLLLGATLGGAVLPALLLGTVSGAAAASVLLARRGRPALRTTIPYGPFLAFGAIATALLLAP
jgi:leader peptidase (prepilin peptidase) / N-methyltransferase